MGIPSPLATRGNQFLAAGSPDETDRGDPGGNGIVAAFIDAHYQVLRIAPI